MVRQNASVISGMHFKRNGRKMTFYSPSTQLCKQKVMQDMKNSKNQKTVIPTPTANHDFEHVNEIHKGVIG